MNNNKFKKVHLLFEQSGTFKNEFIKLGYKAYDYDIVQTDHVDYRLDLFYEINHFNIAPTIFDKIGSNDLDYYYRTFLRLLRIAYLKGFKLIIENPYNAESYLYRYAPIRPTIIDYDRRLNGDYFVKPTMYYFINFTPSNNFIFEPLEYVDYKRVCDLPKGIDRSLIHPQYANRFIREYIL